MSVSKEAWVKGREQIAAEASAQMGCSPPSNKFMVTIAEGAI